MTKSGGGRPVEEDHPCVTDQSHGQVEAALHAAGVRRGRLRRNINEVELLEHPPDAASGFVAGSWPSRSTSPASCRMSVERLTLRQGQALIVGGHACWSGWKRYPIPGSVSRCLGRAGFASSFWRSFAM